MTKTKSNFWSTLLISVLLLGLLGGIVFASLTIADYATDVPGEETTVTPPDTDTPDTDTPGTDTPGTDTPGTDTPGTDTPSDGTDEPDNPTPVNIVFSFDDMIYHVTQGTTWEEFDAQLAADGNDSALQVVYAGALADSGVDMFLHDGVSYVRSDDVIVNGTVYTFREWQDVPVEVVIDGETETYQVCEALTWADYFSEDLKETVFDSRFKVAAGDYVYVITSDGPMYLDLDGAQIRSFEFVTFSAPYTTDKVSALNICFEVDGVRVWGVNGMTFGELLAMTDGYLGDIQYHVIEGYIFNPSGYAFYYQTGEYCVSTDREIVVNGIYVTCTPTAYMEIWSDGSFYNAFSFKFTHDSYFENMVGEIFEINDQGFVFYVSGSERRAVCNADGEQLTKEFFIVPWTTVHLK